jgi:hypothetical protein
VTNDDSALREVDRAVAEDRQWAALRQNGPIVIAGALAIVAVVGGWQIWSAQKTSRAGNAAIEFNAASDTLRTNIEALMQDGAWLERYVVFELDLLADLGFGLNLGTCAVTGSNEDLAFVSPRSGRAVSRGAAGPYVDRLLPLPRFLTGRPPADAEQIRAGLRLTGAFLRRHLFEVSDSAVPRARQLLLDRLDRSIPS